MITTVKNKMTVTGHAPKNRSLVTKYNNLLKMAKDSGIPRLGRFSYLESARKKHLSGTYGVLIQHIRSYAGE